MEKSIAFKKGGIQNLRELAGSYGAVVVNHRNVDQFCDQAKIVTSGPTDLEEIRDEWFHITGTFINILEDGKSNIHQIIDL